MTEMQLRQAIERLELDERRATDQATKERIGDRIAALTEALDRMVAARLTN